ncbi:MAG TPA: SUMF1/EgtB/PvdO family nonheme iron enzyme [Nitrospiria bacterium]
MVKIPAGSFTMGTNETDTENKAAEVGIRKEWFVDEHPARRVNLPTYFIDRFEVTNTAYYRFIQQTGNRIPPHWEGGGVPENIADHPVTYVSWEDANAYCLWAGKRLPTEAEWEKAARGPNGALYPWGNQFDPKIANINGLTGGTAAVGSYGKSSSPYGVQDVTGNVWEWTADWYQAYPGNDYHSDLFGEKARVLRGNSWAGLGHFSKKDTEIVKAHYSRASHRLFLGPTGRVNDVGFRCAKSKS